MTTAIRELNDIGPRRPPSLPRSDAARVWAGFVMVVAGVVLICLGGGALVGVLEVLRMPSAADSDARVLRNVLYAVAGACFLAAALLLMLAVRGLCRIMGERANSEDVP
jgi:drug/metabolite transporter (DMT)-like permease